MNPEKAKFILGNFRPDGADACDPDFAEALKLAIENRELGEWFAKERAFDSTFSAALNSVDLPENLHEDILRWLAAERGDFPQAETSSDAAWISALATIQPPASLRKEILIGMERTVKDTPKKKASILRRVWIPLAAAAGIALAFFVADPLRPKEIASAPAVSVEALQHGFSDIYQSPLFRLDKKSPEISSLVDYMKKEGLPIAVKLPNGLQKLSSLGCRELVIHGKRGSLFLFQGRRSRRHPSCHFPQERRER
ncbi:MAG: DUF3379 domain-containing protein [Akkermansiaceae bacterium]|nr:DUF3379 domain-containing protein [Akkermansiaceae bacterium]